MNTLSPAQAATLKEFRKEYDVGVKFLEEGAITGSWSVREITQARSIHAANVNIRTLITLHQLRLIENVGDGFYMITAIGTRVLEKLEKS